MNAIEEELYGTESEEVIIGVENIEIVPERKTGHFFIGGRYHDNLDDIPDYKILMRRNKD